MERKLTAILSADVKGYSRLMGVDEEGTLKPCWSLTRASPCPLLTIDGRLARGAASLVEIMGPADL